ncbi:ester hydrolase C11orf54-like [Ischnura elegans]|uniref:ester hydrolase C11orf54-like n=1 Tax=Ischnura elegans TaxID=197161 RepID=UPI001ED86E9F|nr:ester hydrolase C11orf54-like [Ischnura elegans]
MENLPHETRDLFCPSLEEIARVLSDGMKSNFAEVKADVVDCPDLSEQPFTLACKGLGGNPKIVEVGGPPYLLPTVNREKVYDLRKIAAVVGSPSAFIIGAGAGPWPYANTNCEMAANLHLKNGETKNLTWIGKVNPDDGTNLAEQLPSDEMRHALLSNLYFSDGNPGQVLRVHCKRRTGSQDFITSIRTTLQNFYKEKPVGLGGTFLLKEGTAKHHVMPDFSSIPLNTDEELNTWLKFYNFSAPLVSVGTLVTADPGLDLRVQHFHTFSHHGEVGHYHIDTQPDSVEYLGYFTLGHSIHRIDRPVVTHQIGRD